MPRPIVSTDDFLRFREFFYRKTGIMFADNKRYFVDKRLQERILSAGFSTFRPYFDMVCFKADGSELQALVNAMTVNETYFYREEYQLKCLARSILPEVVKTLDRGAIHQDLVDALLHRGGALLHRALSAGAL